MGSKFTELAKSLYGVVAVLFGGGNENLELKLLCADLRRNQAVVLGPFSNLENITAENVNDSTEVTHIVAVSSAFLWFFRFN